MSALDQAFLKAYSQQNPAEAAKKTCAQPCVEKTALALETAEVASSKKGRTTRAAKPSAKTAVKKPAAHRGKKVASVVNPPHVTREKAAKKPKTAAVKTSSASALNAAAKPEVNYRLDLPATKSGEGISTGARSSVSAPHTEIFRTDRGAKPQTIAPPQKATASKIAPSPARRMPAANPSPQPIANDAQASRSFSGGWSDEITHAFSNIESNAAVEIPPEPSPIRTPAEILGSLSVSAKAMPAEKHAPVTARQAQPMPASKYEAMPAPAAQETADEDVPQSPAIRLFQPMLQVEHFAWPKICGRLEDKTQVELDRVIDALLAAQFRGKKTFLLGGCRSGDGASSLLLTTARRLASQGLKAALVEGDWSQPQLARRLGLLPQYGWEDVLCGRMPLEEVLIESVAERLVILPVREPFGVGELPDDAQDRIVDTWASLRHHFDLILVDPGPLAKSPILDRNLANVMAGCIDAALLMKNLRRQDDGEFEAVAQALGDAGTKVIGVIENFVG